VSLHLICLYDCYVGITDDRKLKNTNVRAATWHDVHTKFHENQSVGSEVTSRGQTPRHDGTISL